MSVGTAHGLVVIERLIHGLDSTRCPISPDDAVALMMAIGQALESLQPGRLAGVLREWQRQLGQAPIRLNGDDVAATLRGGEYAG